MWHRMAAASAATSVATLAYPEKFEAAAATAGPPEHAALELTDETRLLLYALHKQATAGPCIEPKPWVRTALAHGECSLKHVSPPTPRSVSGLAWLRMGAMPQDA